MCKVGDIILINSYSHNGKSLKKHSFVVLDDRNGEISGLEYDMIANVLSSFKSEEQKAKKLSYPGNFSISNEDTVTNPDNGKSGYLKADQLYYFKKSKLSYRVIGYVVPEIMDLIIEFINSSDFGIEIIIDNL